MILLTEYHAVFILVQLILKSEVIRDHGDELAISGFATVVLDSVAEVRVEGVNVTAIPCNLNGVAYSALNAACCGLVFLCDRGVEYLKRSQIHRLKL